MTVSVTTLPTNLLPQQLLLPKNKNKKLKIKISSANLLYFSFFVDVHIFDKQNN